MSINKIRKDLRPTAIKIAESEHRTIADGQELLEKYNSTTSEAAISLKTKVNPKLTRSYSRSSYRLAYESAQGIRDLVLKSRYMPPS